MLVGLNQPCAKTWHETNHFVTQRWPFNDVFVFLFWGLLNHQQQLIFGIGSYEPSILGVVTGSYDKAAEAASKKGAEQPSMNCLYCIFFYIIWIMFVYTVYIYIYIQHVICTDTTYVMIIYDNLWWYVHWDTPMCGEVPCWFVELVLNRSPVRLGFGLGRWACWNLHRRVACRAAQCRLRVPRVT